MSLPDVVRRELGDEDPVTRVHLGGDDELFVTPTRTVIYRAEGLLSDESVESYPHDAERLTVSEGRRKSSVQYDYGVDGERTFKLPAGSLEEVIHPVVAGVLSARGVTDPGETVERTFRFSELTLVVTNQRLVKHIGTAVWDEEYESFHYDDVTDIEFEEGSVNTSVVLRVGGRQRRFKTPAEDARAVKESLTNALLAYYEVDTLAAFREVAKPDESDEPDEEPTAEVDFGGGVDPLGADPPEPDDETTVAEAADPEGGPKAFDASEHAGESVPSEAAGEVGHAGGDPSGGAGGQADSAGRNAVPEGAGQSAGGADGIESQSGGSGTHSGHDQGAAGSQSPAGGGQSPASDPAPDRNTGDGRATVDETSDPAATGRQPATEEPAADTNDDRGAFADSGFEPASPEEDLREEIEQLRETVERQEAELRRQGDLIEQLIEELRRGR